MTTAHFTLGSPDSAGEFRSNLTAGNGEIVAASEGYTDRRDADQWGDDMLRWVVEASEPTVRAAIHKALTASMSSEAQRDLVADDIIARLILAG